ncbi:MAG: hypothetical protein IJC02_03580 [Lachnospiraceae bacterium]|nr:hypothetical protein [Lachnospiraceae bacterium]MBQ6993442.1 hypothetical protein [Lachnospiraceae bacterium]
MKRRYEYIKTLFAMTGILLWIGAVSPEIFVEGGMGCIKDENGEDLTRQEAQALLEDILYGEVPMDENVIVYKSKILEWIQGSLE